MSQAVHHTRHDPALPEPSEFFYARVPDKFMRRFEECTTSGAPSVQASLQEEFSYLIKLGQQIIHEMLTEYRELQTAIETSPVFSSRQKMILTGWLDHGSLPPARMSALLQLAEWARQEFSLRLLPSLAGDHAANTIAHTLTNFAKGLQHEADSAIKERMTKTPGTTPDEADRKNLIDALCKHNVALVACGLGVQEAQKLLSALNGEVGKKALLLAQDESSTPDIAPLIHDALRESLLRRATEVSEEFHVLMTKMLPDRTALPKNTEWMFQPPSGLAVPNDFAKAVADCTLTLTRANGAPFIDTSDWAQLDDATKMQKMDEAYQEILASFFSGNADAAYDFMNGIMVIDSAVESICLHAGDLNPVRLQDGTAVNALIQPGTRHLTVTLLGMEHEHLFFSTVQRQRGIRGASAGQGNTYWLDRNKSELQYECVLMQKPNGYFILQEPMHVKSHLIRGNWPNIYYPEPSPDDLHSPHYLARDDLLDYAFSGNDVTHVALLTALDALHAFGESPSTEDALSFCSQYIDTGVLACLGDISAEHNLIAQLRFDQENAEPFIQALNMINATLLDILIEQRHSYDHEDAAFELRDQIIEFTTHPKLEDLYRINEQLFAQNGRFARLREVIPEEELAPLREALERVLFPPDASIFAALKTRIIDFIAEEVLPGFIVATRERFASTNV